MNENEKENKKYRPNVAAVIVSSKYPQNCEIFIAERSDIEGVWQFPQGGIDNNEKIKDALLRELEEEIGTKDVEIVAEYPNWISYDFPMAIAKKMYPFDGQKQRYFLVKLKNSAVINLDTKIPEFSEYSFINIDTLFDRISNFKKPIYRKIIGYFKKNGYL